MVDPVTRARLAYRGGYVLLAVAVIFVGLLPFSLGEERFPDPDILTLLAFAWVLRRPDFIPAWLVAVVMLFCDVVFMRPPGLWAALVLIGLEFLRSRDSLTREQPFAVEWFMVSATFSFMTMANTAILALFLVPQPTLKVAALHMVVSVAFYPVVALISRFGFRVERLTPGEADAIGHRA